MSHALFTLSSFNLRHVFQKIFFCSIIIFSKILHFLWFFAYCVSRRQLLIDKIRKRSALESLIQSIDRMISELEWDCHWSMVVIFISIICCDLNEYWKNNRSMETEYLLNQDRSQKSAFVAPSPSLSPMASGM